MHEHASTVAASERAPEHLQGHWVLARAGKRVLRPGGRELTEKLIDAAKPHGARVVELAPGLGLTAELVLDMKPLRYVGIERDAGAASQARDVIGERGTLIEADAADTGLEAGSADLVIGEAMLTMQGEAGKNRIIAEARRLLADGGRYAVHELALRPDAVPSDVKEDVRRSLAQAIKVNARPLTAAEWRHLFDANGFVVEWSDEADMALLQPRRLLADEGVRGVARIVTTMMREPELRRRILTMRATFRRNRDHLCAIALVARRDDATLVAEGAAPDTVATEPVGTQPVDTE